MKITELKVKIKTLAAEARIIALEEQRALRRLAHAGEGRTEAAKAAWQSLREHRRGVVGTAARRSLLAYGFLRGLPYARIEPSNSSKPDWDEVWRVAERFAPSPGRTRVDEPERAALTERWAAWRTAAEAHRETCDG